MEANSRTATKAEPRNKPDEPALITYAQALKEIMDRDYCFSRAYGNQQMRAVRDGAHPDILEFEATLVRQLRKLGVPMWAHCVMRTEAEQNAAYVRGVSKVKWPNSAHNKGCAVDVIHGIKAWDIPLKSWEVIGHIGHEIGKAKGIKLVWGGRDSPTDKFDWDPAHWELANWRVRARELA